jgi:hypothetical protein
MVIIITLLIAVMGGFTGWVSLQMLLPFRVPQRLGPVAIAAVAYGVMSIPSLHLQLAIAAVAGVVLLYRWAEPEVLPPWRIHLADIIGAVLVRVPRPKPRAGRPEPPSKTEITGQGYRPSGERGRRIPEL